MSELLFRRRSARLPILALLGCLAIVAGDAAAEARQGRVEWVEAPALSLEGNLLDTPTVQRVAVYLPPSYDGDGDARYPVVYLLHGIFDSPEVWLRFFELPGLLDRATDAGTIRELIVVMPTGRNILGGGFYRNSPVAGNWGDFVRRELVAFVDGRYRTIAARESRAVAGHSMGGFGAIWHAMTSADVFGVAYAMSPALLDVEDDVSHGNQLAWRGMLEMRGREGLEARLEQRDFWAVAAWNVCTVFLPDPEDSTYRCSPPYRLERSELIPDEEPLDRWRSALPVAAADEHVGMLRSMKGIALDYGFDDQFAHIPETTQRLSDVLAELRVPHDLFVYRGDHRKQLKQRLAEVVFPWISARLAN
jgi:S-formylglutathione hydrolase FrmB